MEKFTEMQIDALREIGSIGAGHAATALSKMINRKVTIKVPNVNIVKIEEAPSIISGAEENVVGVYFKLTKDIPGSSLVVFPFKSALLLADIITGKPPGSTKKVGDSEKSALMETGNIIAGSYLTALGSMTNLVVMQSVPYIAQDTAGTIFNSVLAEVGLASDIALMIEIEFIEASKKLQGWFYMLPDVKSTPKILDALGVNE